MGADVHAYIEYTNFKRADGTDYWSPLGGQLFLGLHYSLFGRLADVRCDGAIFAPRGLPDDLAWEAVSDSRVRVVEDGDPDADRERYVERSKANSWGKVYTVGSSEYVDDPDLHSHTWLTATEFRQVLQAQEEAAVNSEDSTPGSTYYAAAAALEALDEGESKSRIILWFDN